MKVIIFGLPLFSKRLAGSLSEYDKENKYKSYDTYYRKKDKVKAYFSISSADCLFSINGTLVTSKLIDIALKKKIPVIMNWVGTDVINALRVFKTGKHRKEYISGVIHYCEVSWIREELKEMGIEAEIVNFLSFDKQVTSKEVQAEKLTILSYIPENRAKFYGIEPTLQLANRFPEINFVIAGMKGLDYQPLPDNVEAMGWVENMEELFDRAHICLRYPEHDGLSAFILEALARGKKVLYKYPFDFCEYCPDDNQLEANVAKLLEKHKAGESLQNEEGAKFISESFNEDFILGGLVERFKKLSDRK